MTYLDTGFLLLKKINSFGYESFIVGGAVRDDLLNLEVNDIDITTNMPIDELKKSFTFKETGEKFLGVTILFMGYSFEVTNFRKDVLYYDNRHPEVVLVDTYLEDSKRRDFTINALAYDENKKLYDYYDGLKDLNNKCIKAIGDPKVRFQEDSLRILRCLYFSSRFNFKIEDNTLKAIIENKYLLQNLSYERIYSYFIKIFYAKYNLGLNYINNYDLFSYIPEYKNWLNVINKDYKENDLVLYYYYNFNTYPPLTSKNDIKRCKALSELIHNDFSNYSIYSNKEYIYSLLDVIKNLKYNYKDINKSLNNLKITNNKDLALSVLDITKNFENENKALVLKRIISLILDGKLENNKNEILKYIRSCKDEGIN